MAEKQHSIFSDSSSYSSSSAAAPLAAPAAASATLVSDPGQKAYALPTYLDEPARRPNVSAGAALLLQPGEPTWLAAPPTPAAGLPFQYAPPPAAASSEPQFAAFEASYEEGMTQGGEESSGSDLPLSTPDRPQSQLGSTRSSGASRRHDLTRNPYAEIAEAVAGRLNESYYGDLFIYPDIEQRSLELDKAMFEITIKAEQQLIEELTRDPTRAQQVATQLQGIRQIRDTGVTPVGQRPAGGGGGRGGGGGGGAGGSGAGMIRRYPGISRRTLGVPGGNTYVPSTRLKSNIKYAAALVAERINQSDLIWEEIWWTGDSVVKWHFAELVALCIAETSARLRGDIHTRTRLEDFAARKFNILTKFSTLYWDESRRWCHLQTNRDTFDRVMSNPVDAALAYVGYAY